MAQSKCSKPLRLIESTEENKFKVNSDALDELKTIDKNIIVIGIIGPYRTGKSYLMNVLAGEKGEKGNVLVKQLAKSQLFSKQFLHHSNS